MPVLIVVSGESNKALDRIGGDSMDVESRTVGLEHHGKRFLEWPTHILGPMPNLKVLNVACWSLVFALFITRFCIPVWIQFKAGKGSIPLMPADFIYFYGIGHIVKDYPALRLYDWSLQTKVFNDIFSDPKFVYGPSPYPPFVGLFFSLFAQVSFRVAFFLWMFVSLGLYSLGIVAIANDCFPGERVKVSLILCFSVATFPFFWGVLVSGQLTSLAVCSVGLAILQERHGRSYLSGLALSIMAYKPTLLLFVIPMLFLTRRFKALAGFMTGGAMLMLVATTFMGAQIWPTYLHFLSLFDREVGLSGHRVFELWKFIEIGSCLQAVAGSHFEAVSIIKFAVTVPITTGLAVLLWKSAAGGRAAQSLAWAATLTWTLLLNVYVPLYDAVLVGIAVVLTLGAAKDLEWRAAKLWTTALSFSMFAISWVTCDIAKSYGIQLISVSLAALGGAQLYMLYCVNQNRVPKQVSVVGVG
jgi:Glycosyltransferase family 87